MRASVLVVVGALALVWQPAASRADARGQQADPAQRGAPPAVVALVPPSGTPARASDSSGAAISPMAASAPQAHGQASSTTGASSAVATGLAPGRLTLVSTRRRLLPNGDPIWELRLALPGRQPLAFEALVGRAEHQQGNRNSLGSQAPLPKGRYRLFEFVSLADAKDVNPELGRELWIGLEPEFSTDRRGLGIHLDPSAGLLRESGTNGCIGLIHARDLRLLGDLLQRSGTTDLQVIN